MFSPKDFKQSFVEKAQQERALRLEQKIKEKAVVKLQSLVRRFIVRSRLINAIRMEVDKGLPSLDVPKIVASTLLFHLARKLLFIYKGDPDDKQRLLLLCKAILTGLDVGKEPKYWYMSVMLCKDFTTAWIRQLKLILNYCCTELRSVKTFVVTGSKAADVYLTVLSVFTDCSDWKILTIPGGENIRPVMQQLCATMLADITSKGLLPSAHEFLWNNLTRVEIAMSNACFTCITTLLLRALNLALYSSSMVMVFVLNVLTVPAVMLHAKSASAESLQMLIRNKVYEKVLACLSERANMILLLDSLDADGTLCLMGNLVTLCLASSESFIDSKGSFKSVFCELVRHCQTFLGRGSSSARWHHLLGWYRESGKSRSCCDAHHHVALQLRTLWKQPLVGRFFENLPTLEETDSPQSSSPESSKTVGSLRKAFMKAFKRSSTTSGMMDLNEPVVIDVCVTCQLYRMLTQTLTQLRLEIVAGLSLQEEILVRLWRFLYSLAPGEGLKTILSYVTGASPTLPDPLCSLLVLFCDCSSQLVPILDDHEIYEKQKPFSVDDLVKMSSFLNALVFKLIWNRPEPLSSHGAKSDGDALKPSDDTVLVDSARDLLITLYNRDCRKSFCATSHWLVKELKIGQFNNELREGRRRALVVLHQIPHVIPHMERVKIFHGWIREDKEHLGIDKENSRASALITVRRSRLLENGYDQLRRYTGAELKGIIRVKFVNEQGLDEAGIDQDGVFKEFLEDVIAEAFNPQLNLFKMTVGDEQRLYPSPTSFIQENHLQLFEFVGKMLGKAVYEGILVDVPFAMFFLNAILRQQKSALYSSIDELPSLDAEMYKNFNFIKNYDGDVADLELVFAYDEDVLGKTVTHDLKPGGRAIKVTNSNKLTYIHLMARHRLHTQIKEQSAAFIRGFQSLISPQWLSIFSGPELQRLISGDTGEIDLMDLKNNTQYLGGYLPTHQTIVWFWDILVNELTVNEKKQFLKFVTSCSRPPLLGFRHLEPPFSIRFVDCSDVEDVGDTAGSIVRGLFGVRRRGAQSSTRLPTASTCFNLLKLPNYNKKSVLREKLRYAISSGAGFELS